MFILWFYETFPKMVIVSQVMLSIVQLTFNTVNSEIIAGIYYCEFCRMY